MIVAHADWSINPTGRWIAIANGDVGHWRLTAPAPVGDVATLTSRLRTKGCERPIVLGVDFPIGLPRSYAQLHAAESDFPDFLRGLAHRPEFFAVCDDIAEVTGARPFYPRQSRKGSALLPHVAALGLASSAQMRRACDFQTADRPAAAAIFWTLGPNQVGKAALSGWRHLLLPTLLDAEPTSLWPFEGRLSTLISRGGLTIAETYPADALRQLGLRLIGSKMRQSDRAALAPDLLVVIARLGAEPDHGLADSIADGYGADKNGDDRFDAVVGLLAILNVIAGQRDDGVPADPWIAQWEGWVLGQAPC